MPRVRTVAAAPDGQAPTQPDETRELGRRIRDLRNSAGMTLADLARRTSVSIGTLSQLERGMVSPTVRTLFTVGNALGVPPGQLIDPTDPTRTGEAAFIVRASRRRRFLDAGGVTKDIASPATSERLKGYFMVIEPGCGSGGEPYTHSGEEIAIVLSGTLELQVDGRTFTVNEGDCFAFASDRPHRFANVGLRPASVFWVNAQL